MVMESLLRLRIYDLVMPLSLHSPVWVSCYPDHFWMPGRKRIGKADLTQMICSGVASHQSGDLD